PALANTTSTRPCFRFTVSYRRSRSARFETSPRTPMVLPPISLTAASSSACRRPVMTTLAPSATNRLAVARPLPLVPPVTTATFPASLRDIGVHLAKICTDQYNIIGWTGRVKWINVSMGTKIERCPVPRGRPRTFDVDKALDKALRTFWRKGYEGATL